MKTVSVKLPDALHAKLTAIAEQRRTSKSDIVRMALQAVIARNGRRRTGSALALARDLAGCVKGPGDLSVNKAYLKDLGR